jgi:hypothetical protein
MKHDNIEDGGDDSDVNLSGIDVRITFENLFQLSAAPSNCQIHEQYYSNFPLKLKSHQNKFPKPISHQSQPQQTQPPPTTMK